MDTEANGNLEKWPQVTRESIVKLKQWLATQPHLPQVQEHDIALFLHANYGDLEATQRTIENYYTHRSSNRECFAGRDIFNEALQTALSIMMITMLPGETKEGYKMIYTRLLTSDTTHFNHPQILKLITMCLDLWVRLEGNANGHIMLMDMQGMHLSHMTKLNMGAAKKHMFYVQEALPIRLKQIHFINVVPFMNQLMFLTKPFMRKDVQEMINMHVNLDTLHQAVPVESLPNEYGGNGGSFDELEKSFKDKLYAHNDWFRTMETHDLVDETKRQSKPKRYLFGLF
ncbi:alpha-tocopherol transfer protein-like [Anopheles ziemanni]|uniref:alpha-tocopherol transfer protein-like n=1 Tax=Anopheles coustani TaxID=139045 RepID=UPI00265AB3A3|nr:alpha-tocopherol transfer protein-like [Anopheles coustani]XP_058167376.1 alpha-tocopherol transfer protein-like [Anopheles ziemanni]